MSIDDFKELYVRLIESHGLDPETAGRLLRKILELLCKDSGGKQEK